jgi:two-component system OmpR family response regulator
MTISKILIIEDEDTLREMLKYNLESEGYTVSVAGNGKVGLELAQSQSPDLVILDIMLPEIDGFEVCKRLRRDMIVPILMLTAKEEEVDKVLGLELGADDYMTKPFSMRELKARVKAMLRRVSMLQQEAQGNSDIITSGNMTIDLSRHRVSLGDTTIQVNPKEFDLLAYLARNKGYVFSRDQLLDRVWGYDFSGDTRTVDVHMRWLREKIEVEPSKPVRLITVRGIGYKFEG